MLTIREYLDGKGVSPFGEWFEGLDAVVAAKITKRRQQNDIESARSRWTDYKRRRRSEK